MMNYDKIILGAGLYGLYAALFCAKHGEKVAVLEYDKGPFMRATHSNQARIHMGYHYPRSLSTAIKSTNYFNRFINDFGFCIHKNFDQIYAISENFSWTNIEQFKKFCDVAGIRCEEVPVKKYFNDRTCEGAFLTEEYTYDVEILKQFFMNELGKYKNISIYYNARITGVEKNGNFFCIKTQENTEFISTFILNATYASVNQVLHLFGFDSFSIKYELCEIVICEVNDKLRNIGITVMDGPFFSIIPFGMTGKHSLTSVTFTPHKTSNSMLPMFDCQTKNIEYCNQKQLGNCNICAAKPISAWPYMDSLARKYLREEFEFKYKNSYFSIKPILKMSEIDDSRPTVIKRYSTEPCFISVLSGKINTVYDLEWILQ